MNDAFKMGQGLGHQLEMGFARNDWTEADVQKLKEGTLLAQVLHLVRGTGVVQIIKHIINLAGDCMPKAWKDQGGWSIRPEDQIKGVKNTGTLEIVDLVRQVVFHLSPNQKDGKVIEGHKLRKELEKNKVPVLNACVLDYLLLHPELIPEDWKKDENGNTRFIYFWGTVFRGADGGLYVRCLFWYGGAWDWDCLYLDDDWDVQNPSAILASVPQP